MAHNPAPEPPGSGPASDKARADVAHGAQVAMRLSEARFRAYITASSDVAFSMSPDWTEMRQLHGRDFVASTEAPTRNWLEKYIHPEDQARVLDAIAEAIRTRSVLSLEHRVLRLDGTLGWSASRAVPLLDERGEIIEWVGAARDITSRRQAEDALRQADARNDWQLRLFDGVASTTPDFVYLFDREGRFQYANRRLLEIWGMQLADVVGKTCRDLGYEQWHHDMHMREIAQVIQTRQAIKGEVPFKAPRTGIFGVYEYIFTPVLGPDGEVELIAGTTRDVTERKRTEEELRQGEQRFRSFVEASAQVVWTVNAASEVDMAIPAWQAYTGQSYEEARGLGWMNAIHPEDRSHVAAAWESAIASRSLYEVEYRLRIRDGSWRYVLARGVPVMNADGTIKEYIGTCIDVTDRKQAEEQRNRLTEHRKLPGGPPDRRPAGRVAHHLGQAAPGEAPRGRGRRRP